MGIIFPQVLMNLRFLEVKGRGEIKLVGHFLSQNKHSGKNCLYHLVLARYDPVVVTVYHCSSNKIREIDLLNLFRLCKGKADTTKGYLGRGVGPQKGATG